MLEVSRRGLLPPRAASAMFWRAAGDGAAIEDDSRTRRVRIGAADLLLELPLRYHQNWSIALGQMPAQDRLALDVFARLAATAQGIFDVGMNAGSYLYTAIGSRRPGVPIVGFEPDEDISAIVRGNVERNHLTNVAIDTCAVSSATGRARLHRASSDQMHTLERAFLEDLGSPIVGEADVRTISLDDATAAHGIEPDLIKIDVEGHEAQVVQGAADLIDRVRPTLIVEMGHASADGELFAELLERGYTASLLAVTAVSVRSRDEFIAARPRGFENYLFQCA